MKRPACTGQIIGRTTHLNPVITAQSPTFLNRIDDTLLNLLQRDLQSNILGGNNLDDNSPLRADVIDLARSFFEGDIRN